MARGKSHLAAPLTDRGSDHSHSVSPTVDADVGFQSRCALRIGFECGDVALRPDASRERERVESDARAHFHDVITRPDFAHHAAPNRRFVLLGDEPARLRTQPEPVAAIDDALESAASGECCQHAIVRGPNPIP